ncbi:hypothetical protein IPJ63_01255 [Candidatus Nomurabacteria bacterium]|nr:MAG: hypothetical protein IPJ63_01255 [Candidatus Nomurabacteria bacterium]
MINLLPFEQRNLIEHNYKMRFVVVIIFFITILLLVAIIFLIPSFVVVNSKLKAAENNLESIKSTEGFKNDETLSDIIKDINVQVDKIALEEKDLSFVDQIILPVVKLKPSQLSLTEFLITHQDKNNIMVQVGGQSPDRDTLLRFVNSLEEVPDFKDVLLPISDYVPGEDIDFSVSFKIQI